MSVALTDEQYGVLLHGLHAVAHGYKTNQFGRRQRLCREELVEEARVVCDALLIRWDQPLVKS